MTEPTDDELDAVIAEYRTRIYPQDMHPRFERAIMRAAIAKWGTPPAVAGEPVACGNCGGSGWMVRDPDIGTDQECFVCDGSGGYSESATPQPTQPQAGAVPLTHMDTKRLAWMADGWTPGHEALYVQHVLNTGGTGSLDDLRTFIDQRIAPEAAHGIGIKGGQHGTDT